MWRVFFYFGALIVHLITCSNAWAVTPVGPTQAIACAPTNVNVIAALVDRSIWLTRDGGGSWTRVTTLVSKESYDDQIGDEQGLVWDLETEPEVYDVGSDEETYDDEARRLEWEPGTFDGATGIPVTDTQSESGVSTGTYLSVSDDGLWVLSIGERLLFGDSSGLSREIYSQGVRGFVFDRLGRLWVTRQDTLFVLGSPLKHSGVEKKWSIPGTLAPVFRSKEKEEILVPAFEGVWIVGATDRSSYGMELVRFGNVSAVADAPSADGMYVARRGRILLYCSLALCEEELPTPPSGPDRLETDNRARVLMRSESGQWFVMESGSFRSIRALSLDVDAKKRVWVGTEFGPFLVGEKTPLTASLIPVEFSAVQSQALGKLSASLGSPPKCRRFPINPLPKTQLFFGLDQDISMRFDTGLVPYYVPYSAHRRSGLYFGLQLTWSLGPLDPSKCYIQQRNWQRMRMERVASVQTLLLERQRVLNAKPQDGSILKTAEFVIRKRRNEELIQIVTEIQAWRERED